MANPDRRHPRYLFRDQRDSLLTLAQATPHATVARAHGTPASGHHDEPGSAASATPHAHDRHGPVTPWDEIDELLRTAAPAAEPELDELRPVHRAALADEEGLDVGVLDV